MSNERHLPGTFQRTFQNITHTERREITTHNYKLCLDWKVWGEVITIPCIEQKNSSIVSHHARYYYCGFAIVWLVTNLSWCRTMWRGISGSGGQSQNGTGTSSSTICSSIDSYLMWPFTSADVTTAWGGGGGPLWFGPLVVSCGSSSVVVGCGKWLPGVSEAGEGVASRLESLEEREEVEEWEGEGGGREEGAEPAWGTSLHRTISSTGWEEEGKNFFSKVSLLHLGKGMRA